MKCYKVVNCINGRYYSALANEGKLESKDETTLEYFIGKSTVPKIGRIFVFKGLIHAKRFIADAYNNDPYAIFEARADELIEQKYISYYYGVECIKQFWNFHVNLDDAPLGSYSCNKLELVRQITK